MKIVLDITFQYTQCPAIAKVRKKEKILVRLVIVNTKFKFLFLNTNRKFAVNFHCKTTLSWIGWYIADPPRCNLATSQGIQELFCSFFLFNIAI